MISLKRKGAIAWHITSWNPRSDLIKGKVCGIQVETIEDPMMKKSDSLTSWSTSSRKANQ